MPNLVLYYYKNKMPCSDTSRRGPDPRALKCLSSILIITFCNKKKWK